MKKLSVLLVCSLFVAACSSSSPKKGVNNQAPQQLDIKTELSKNILLSDAAAVQETLNKMENVGDNWLNHAVSICDPYRRQGRTEKVKFVCDKEQNAQIIKMLMDRGTDPNKYVNFAKKEADTLYVVETLADKLAVWNPGALQYVLPKMDKCLIALTKMQTANPSKAKYFSFADFWRDNQCSIDNYNLRWYNVTGERENAAFLIGKTKEDVKNKYGEPTIYDHPSAYREVLTYKKAEERQEKGQYEAGVRGVNIFIDEVHYIFTLDRGVITKVQVQVINTTQGDGETQTVDLEKAKQDEIAKKEKLAGTVEDSFAKQRMLKRMRGSR